MEFQDAVRKVYLALSDQQLTPKSGGLVRAEQSGDGWEVEMQLSRDNGADIARVRIGSDGNIASLNVAPVSDEPPKSQ